jgi:hypothetical protein
MVITDRVMASNGWLMFVHKHHYPTQGFLRKLILGQVKENHLGRSGSVRPLVYESVAGIQGSRSLRVVTLLGHTDICGVDKNYALVDNNDHVVSLEACARGEVPVLVLIHCCATDMTGYPGKHQSVTIGDALVTAASDSQTIILESPELYTGECIKARVVDALRLTRRLMDIPRKVHYGILSLPLYQ